MVSLDYLEKSILKQWDLNTNIVLMLIKNDSTIKDCNKKFEKYLDKFSSLEQLITYTHKAIFIKNLSKCIKEKSTLSFTSNFSYNPSDVEDIPFTYNITLEYKKEDEIVVIAEPIAPLSHEDARSYFSMINEYSSLSRKLQKTNFNLNKKNEQLKESLEKVEYYANYDHLTKLFNRRRIFEELEKEYKKYQRLEEEFCIVIFDIDDFKQVNDNFGHQSGDLVLAVISKTIKKMLREYDSLGRYGGEEFIAILPSTNEEKAIIMCQRILKEISLKKITLENEENISITLSAGVEQIRESMTLNELISNADTKLYKVKESGKNNVL